MPLAVPRPPRAAAAQATSSSESDPPQPSAADRPHYAALASAIAKADAATLRTALTTLCRVDCDIEKAAALLLLVPAGVGGDGEATGGGKTSKKRKSGPMELTARYEVCGTCDKTFDVLKNGPEACQTHEGELEIDEEFFPDDDEIASGYYVQGAIGEDERIDYCPEGFSWNCCDRTTHEEACLKQRHVAKA